MSRDNVIEAIRNHESFLITTHRYPEADAIGSSLALAHILRHLGKKSQVICYDPIPRLLKFLPHRELLQQKSSVASWPQVVFVLDCGNLERTGLLGGDTIGVPPLASILVNIDHHVSNRKFGKINWVDPEAAATAEMIYEMSEAMGVKPSFETALCLYTALISETGFFAYSNTRPKTMKIAARLLEQGVDPWEVAQQLRENTPERLRLVSEVLRHLSRSPDGHVAWITVSLELLEKTKTTAEDTEDLINFPRFLGGVEVAVLFREEGPRTYKISLRSKNVIDVASVAEQFGGGGHRKAAGCTMTGSLQDVRDRLLNAVNEALIVAR
jgi:bifunctional oligoribonuclease and PAP phosphatase NrnA